MHVMLCESVLWVPTSIAVNPLYVQHLDPETFYHPKYGLVISNRYTVTGEFLQFLETGVVSKAYPSNANIDLGVTFGKDRVLRAWSRIAGKVVSRSFVLNDRMPRLLDTFQSDIDELTLATAIAIQQLRYNPRGFDGGFLRNHPEWRCSVHELLSLLYRQRYSVRPPEEWVQIDLTAYSELCGSFLQLPVIIGNGTKKGKRNDDSGNQGRETGD